MRTLGSLPKRSVAGLMVFLLIGSLSYLPIPSTENVKHAKAAVATTIIGGNGTVQESITAGNTTFSAALQDAFYIKEFRLDGIAHGLAKMLLKSMTQSILNWINSGFQGKPAFITDLKQFMLDRVDQTVGEFIYNDPALNFLCSPFQLDVKIALAQSYQQSAHDGFGSKAQCTLSQVTDNVEGFLSGDFSQGGWQSWFEVTQNPVNTPTGAYLAAETELSARIIDEQGNTLRELDWGDGFLSFKVCADSQVEKNCDITTPGRVIADQINKSLGAGQDALISADEINEIITALFAQLAEKALTGTNGLLGLGGSSYSDDSYGASGSSSYLDALMEESETSSGIANPFEEAITREQENTALQQRIVSMVNSTQTKIRNARTRYGSCISVTMPDDLLARRDAASARITQNDQNIVTLTSLNNSYLATKDAQTQLDLVNTLTADQQNGTYTAVTDNILLKVDVNYTLQQQIDALESDLSNEISSCSTADRGGSNR